MSRKTSGPRKPRNGKPTSRTPTGGEPKNGVNGGRHGPGNGAGDSSIIRLTSSPAFDLWLDRQTKRIVDASARAPGQDLVDLIRTWSGNSLKKGPGKITD